jgi:phosphoribosyl 1,2-cyclic phosphodiesterase
MDPGADRSGRVLSGPALGNPRRGVGRPTSVMPRGVEHSVQFAVLASGSRGNATLIQAGGVGLLVDVGIGPRALAHRLESVGSCWERIGAALLTHTHGDHIDDATLQAMARRRVLLLCHEAHREGLASLAGFRALDESGLVRCYGADPFLTPAGLRVEPVPLSHDSGPTFGFRVEGRSGRSGRSVALGYLADTGSWSAATAEALTDVDLLGVEFNHDVEMQRRSGRSQALIARVLGDRGHLSNAQGADFVAAVLARSRPGALRHLVLLHLSQQCNQPRLALGVARLAVRGTGRRVAVHAALQAAAHPNLWVAPARRRTAADRSSRGARSGNSAGPWQGQFFGFEGDIS